MTDNSVCRVHSEADTHKSPQEMIEELRSYIPRLEQSGLFQLLDLGGDRVLFRVDGLAISISDPVYALLSDVRQLPERRIAAAIGTYGLPVVREVIEELRQLDADGILSHVQTPVDPSNLSAVQPSGVTLMVTQSCNLKCSYCYGDGGTYGSGTPVMAQSVADAAIRLMLHRSPDKARFVVTFFGGEPLLNFPLIRSVVEFCRRVEAVDGKEFSFTMTTNGTIVNDEILHFLKDNRFALMVSFDGPRRYHDRNRLFRSGVGSYATVSRNIRRLVGIGLPVELRSTLVRGMASRRVLSALTKTTISHGCSKLALAPADVTKKPSTDLALRPQDLASLTRLYRRVSEETIDGAVGGRVPKVVLEPHVTLLRSLFRGNPSGFSSCGACFGMCAVSTEGSIYPCHRFVGMDAFVLGDVVGGLRGRLHRGFLSEGV